LRLNEASARNKRGAEGLIVLVQWASIALALDVLLWMVAPATV